MSATIAESRKLLVGIREDQEKAEAKAKADGAKATSFLTICPRCGENYILYPLVFNSVSKVDNRTYICTSCGKEEGFGGKEAIQYFPAERWYALRIKDMMMNGHFDEE